MPAAHATTQLSRDEELLWIALLITPGLGSRKAIDLVRQFRTPKALFRASASELTAAGAAPAPARAIACGATMEDAARQHQSMLDLGACLIPIADPCYPELLRNIYDPPLALFARGLTEALERPMFGIVGSRRATPYGMAAAGRLAGDLAQRGLIVVSGMAAGIDTAAHTAALDAGFPTIAVFGCGVDVIYPAHNRRLAQRIVENGLVLSEFPMGTPAYPQNFPIRNRIVSGLSAGVMVVEGSQYSGSAITARLAADQGREVFAVPGNITSPLSWSPNLLIKQGAHLVQNAEDILAALPTGVRAALRQEPRDETNNPLQASLLYGASGTLQAQLLEVIGVDTPISLDDLVEKILDHSPSEIIAALLELEFAGRIRQLPGKTFVRVWV